MAAPKDKRATTQVLGCLMKNPLLIVDDKYPLTVIDFPERFHRILYGAIEHLSKSGVQEITFSAVDDFLTKHPQQHKVFTDNNGCEYILNAMEQAETNNYEYYYGLLRKFSVLNQFIDRGFDVSDIYNNDITNFNEQEQMRLAFEQMSVEDIFDHMDAKILEVKNEYANVMGSTGKQAAEGLVALKEKYKEAPEMGMPMGSAKMTTILRGRRLKKLYLKTSPSGFGKTRISLGDACRVSIPRIYDSKKKKWFNTGCKEPTLFITTELEIDEIQSLVMAYVADVSEDHIIDGKYAEGEEERVDQAIKIISNSPLYIEHIPNFNVDDIERTIKRYKLKHGIGYVFFDYVFVSIKILAEITSKTKGMKLREDNVLIMFIDRMKTLCNTLNVHIDTSSQANGDWKTAKDGDQNLIRGAKGMADKVDAGMVILPLTAKDRDAVHDLIKPFSQEPNLVIHVYKVRRSKINHVKVWIYFDYGTCRMYDLFVTDNDYKLLPVEDSNIELILSQTEEGKGDFVY